MKRAVIRYQTECSNYHIELSMIMMNLLNCVIDPIKFMVEPNKFHQHLIALFRCLMLSCLKLLDLIHTSLTLLIGIIYKTEVYKT